MKKNITIFWGGTDGERTVSEQTYHTFINHIDTDRYNIDTIEIATDGSWVKDDQQVEPESALLFTDYAWIAGHGSYMEDGQLQKILEEHRVPHNGSQALESRICFSKSATKELFEIKNIKTPAWQSHVIGESSAEELADELFQNFPQPCIIKPDQGGSSLGISIAGTKPEIIDAINRAKGFTQKIIVEEYINGQESTVGVVDQLRDTDHYALPPVEIVSHADFFDYEAKYDGKVDEICPAHFSDDLKQDLEQLAIRVHVELGLQDYSRVDFMIHPERGIYVLEVNTLPGMTKESLLPKELDAVGIDLSLFYSHVISLG